LHVFEVGVWWKTIAQRVTGSVFFHETLNSERCARLIILPFLDKFTEEEKFYWHFMQDNATIHIAKNSMAALSEVFGESHKSRTVASAITRLKSLCPLFVGHAEKK
jgi:hypothetical protein